MSQGLDALVHRLSERESLQSMLFKLHAAKPKKLKPKEPLDTSIELLMVQHTPDLDKAHKLVKELTELIAKDSFKQIQDKDGYNIFISLTGATTELNNLLKNAKMLK